MGLVIGEGIETCLTAARRYGLSPVWALGSAGGIERFPILPGLEGLTILTENDAANEKAARACAHGWHAAGRRVFFVDPEPQYNDLNDEARGKCK
jgi:hypothetical protein